jgi:hypothetical protein
VQRLVEIGRYLLRQVGGRGDKVNQVGINDALRHAVEFGLAGILRQTQPTLFLNRLQAEHAVRAHPGKNHADGAVDPLLRQTAQKEIHRQPQGGLRRRIGKVENPMQQGQVLVGRNNIDVVGLYLYPVLYLHHRQVRDSSDQLGQDTGMASIQMLDDDESHATVGRHIPEKLLQRLQAAGRTADAHDGEILRTGFRSGLGFRSLLHLFGRRGGFGHRRYS